MNAPEPPEPPESSGPPPFAYLEDPAFVADMELVAPNEKVRDEICNDLQWTIKRILVDGEVPPGLASLGDGTTAQLLITQKTGISPALRIVFSVVDEYPKRHVYLHAAALRDQNGSS